MAITQQINALEPNQDLVPIPELNQQDSIQKPTLQELIIRQLRTGPKFRNQLVAEINKPRTTIYDCIKKMILDNKIKTIKTFKQKKCNGRPKIAFVLI